MNKHLSKISRFAYCEIRPKSEHCCMKNKLKNPPPSFFSLSILQIDVKKIIKKNQMIYSKTKLKYCISGEKIERLKNFQPNLVTTTQHTTWKAIPKAGKQF